MNPAEGSVRRGDDWYDPLSVRTVPAAQFHRFNEWDDLRKAAYALVDEAITEMESQYRDYYPKGQNPSTRDRWETDADQFAAYLFSGRRPMDSRDDKRLERFAKMIGVDYPADKKNRTT